MARLIDRWFEVVRSVDVVSIGTRNEIAIANMAVLKLDAPPAPEPQEAEIARFIEKAFRHYVRKLPNTAGGFVFYSWVDEQSGTLRCSAAATRSLSDLPFKRAVAITDQPTVIAREFLACPFKNGIPMVELVDVNERMGEPPASGPLSVFARWLSPEPADS